jgi:hypothetical protein
MIQLSPRSYVFNGLEIIREPLIGFIGQVLQKDCKSWWHDYVYEKLKDEKEEEAPIQRSGSIADLYKQLDESRCFKIILHNQKLFRNAIKKIDEVERLRDIRNSCAHVFLVGGVISKEFADEALFAMICFIDPIDKECTNKLSELRSQLYTQAYEGKKVVASKESLIAFLNDKIWNPSFEMLNSIEAIDEGYKNSLKSDMEKSLKDINEFQTSKEIEHWFNRNLLSTEGTKKYLELKELNLPTFEDKRLEFRLLCFGE